MDLAGKVTLMTGGARIGATVAEILAGRGSPIALSYRSSKAAVEATAARIRSSGGKAVALRADLTDADEAASLVRRTADELGRVDILINMASVYEKQDWEKLDREAWDRNMDANARSATMTSLAAAPMMKRQGSGRIINFSDWTAASDRPRYKGFLPYYVSKHAVLGLTQALALELAPEVLVNAIAPGPILPPPDLSREETEAIERTTPLGRWGGAEEVAKAVLFLIESDFVTGECIRVDGGRHLR